MPVYSKKSEYRRYFISYCCIALIPVAVLLVALMIVLQHNFSSNSQELYRRSIAQISSHFDAIFQDLQSSVNSFTAADPMTSAVASETRQTGEGVDSITNYLAQQENGNRLHAQVLFYLVGDTDVYTSQGKIPYTKLEESLAPDADLNLSSFFTNLNHTDYFNMIPLYQSGNEQSRFSKYVVALFPYYSQALRQKGTFAYLIERSECMAVIRDYIGTDPDFFYLYTPNLELVMAEEISPQSTETRLQFLRMMTGSIARKSLSNGSYDMLRHKSDQYGYHFVLGVPLDQLYMSVSKLQSKTFLILFLVMVGAVIGAICLARYSYRPIRALLETIQEQGDGAEKEEMVNGRELDYIGMHLNRVHSQVRKLNDTLERQQPVVRGHVLQRVLRGSTDEGVLRQLESFFPKERLSGYCYCALVCEDGSGPETNQHSLREEIALDGAEGYGVFLEEDRLVAFLIFCESGEDQRLLQCRDLLDNLLISGSLSAGLLVKGVEHLSESFLEAYIALNNRSRADSGEKIHIYQQEGNRKYTGNHWELQKDMEIYLQSLRSVDGKTASSLLNGLLQKMSDLHSSLLNASYIRYELFIKALSTCEEEIADQFRLGTISIDFFADAHRFAGIMLELTQKNCQRVEEKRGSALDQRRKRILALIQEHCFEADFSLSRLSEMAQYSPTYINRFLKDEIGLSYTQYISGQRLEKAKYELAHTDKKIKDIVPECGYVDITSFNRKFKEYEGVTPGEYRTLHQKQPL